ncbi:nucleoprotein [Souris virus]|uniref:Nucleoprotein n=1 Tax=Souris virus TaxID=2010246 RepID=A0A0B6C0Z8_9VIRU|nr:nucleoprotein [Souris virus]AJI43722.1 nucleoprotein [Souris virus]
MALSKEVKSYQWTQLLRKELATFTNSVKVSVIKDSQILLHSLDFSEVSNVQRIMRKEKRTDADLKRLRDLNQKVNNLVELKSVQQKNVLRVGRLSNEELLSLAADIEKLKTKILRTERPLTSGVYMGNLTSQQLEDRTKLLAMVGISRPNQVNGVVRVWDIKDSSLLNNQFGTMPSLTMACMAKQGQTELNDVVLALSDLGLLYTVKYPNLEDLAKLSEKHPILSIVTQQPPQINSSGYNFSLSAAVKAGATMIEGGNMLETIRITPSNIEDVLKAILSAKKKGSMFISDTPGQRNPYENLLYKVCLSGQGWPYIASRTSIVGRAWDNTLVDLGAAVKPGPSNSERQKVNGAPNTGLTYSQMMLLKEVMTGIDPTAKTWIDIEGRPEDPVEIAIFQPDTAVCIHFFREPVDKKQFQSDSKHSHGLDIMDLFNTQPGLTSAVMELLPKGMVLTCQGSDDIYKLLKSQGRSDIKLIDISMTKEQSRKFEDAVWDSFGRLCGKHTGLVTVKVKKNRMEITPHCALLDCIMFESCINDRLYDKAITNILPEDLIFRIAPEKVLL